MRVTSSVRAFVRSCDDAIKDMRSVLGVTMRYGIADAQSQPIDAQPFTISSALTAKDFFKISHRRTYEKVKDLMATPDQIVNGSRYALKRILEAIRKKDLSPLSPLLLDPSILSEIATKIKLPSLTKRQLSCLDVSDVDYLGMDGIVDRWNKIDLPEDNPSGLLSSLKIGKCEKLKKPILTYSVDMAAMYRKKVLIKDIGILPIPKGYVERSVPRAYGLPFRRRLFATVEFAHVGTDAEGKFSEEPFLKDFHVHSC